MGRALRDSPYAREAPFLTDAGAAWLVDHGAVLVGIDSINIDDMGDPRRPAHSRLLAAGIPIVEHLRGLEQLPATGFRFSAAPPRIQGLGTFPVRAYATSTAEALGFGVVAPRARAVGLVGCVARGIGPPEESCRGERTEGGSRMRSLPRGDAAGPGPLPGAVPHGLRDLVALRGAAGRGVTRLETASG